EYLNLRAILNLDTAVGKKASPMIILYRIHIIADRNIGALLEFVRRFDPNGAAIPTAANPRNLGQIEYRIRIALAFPHPGCLLGILRANVPILTTHGVDDLSQRLLDIPTGL